MGALPSVPASNLIKVTHIQWAGNCTSWTNISWIFVEWMDKIVTLIWLLSKNADMYKKTLKCWKRIIKLSANLLIHSYAVCQPLGVRGPFSAYFCLARQEVCLLLLIVLSPSERGKVLGGPNRFYCSKKTHCKFHDAFASPDLNICKRDWKKKAFFIYHFIISDCESVLMG